MDWIKHRRPDGTIDLVAAWEDENGKQADEVGRVFLRLVESHTPIDSMQTAAVALASADAITALSLSIADQAARPRLFPWRR